MTNPAPIIQPLRLLIALRINRLGLFSVKFIRWVAGPKNCPRPKPWVPTPEQMAELRADIAAGKVHKTSGPMTFR